MEEGHEQKSKEEEDVNGRTRVEEGGGRERGNRAAAAGAVVEVGDRSRIFPFNTTLQ